MHSIETGIFFGRIPYTKVGSGLNPILVINGGQGFMMMPDTARISKDARRLTSVLPQGRSFILLGYDPDAAKVTVDGLAADVSNIIDQHLGGTADVVGLSYGGVVASRVAMRSPQHIDKLALMASAPWFSEEGKQRLLRQIELIDAGDLIKLLREFTSMCRSPWLNVVVDLRVRLSGSRMAQRLGRVEVIRRYLAAMLDSEPSLDFSAFRTPTVIVGGSRDQFFADAMVEVRVRGPGIKTAIFEGETHMVPIERARAVKQIVSDFLAPADQHHT
ncbi:MAG: alpha/beta hydrolase [Verrucomicrobiaceae bacterium]|nr:MAG: alpha/beta hydrolase [Verrucomicrobiaceae bacterium]